MNEIAFPKPLAERTYAYYGDIRRCLSNDHASNTRWMMATFLTLNAGGLLALVNFTIFHIPIKYAGLSFWFGIFFAVAISWYSQIKTKKFLYSISKLEEYWAVVAETGRADSEKATKLEDAKNTISTRAEIYLAVGSFMCFSIGVLIIGVNL